MKYAMPFPSDQAKLWGHVASLPCQAPGCDGACGPVQVAHSNAQKDGKGMGLKSYPWRVAAMGRLCHENVDSGPHLTKEARRAIWDEAHRGTIGELFRRGLVRPI